MEEEDWKDWEYKFGAWKRAYNFGEIPIDIDVHFIKVNEQKIQKVAAALKKLSTLHLVGTHALQKEFENGRVVQEYIRVGVV